jgi:hypothetical protein
VYNRIYQLSTEPVKQEDYITESDFIEHPFVGSVADCVDESNSRDQDISELMSVLGCTNIASFVTDTKLPTVSFTFVPGAHEIYFSSKYNVFAELREKTSGMGLSEFASGYDFENALWGMNSAFCKKYDIYVALGEPCDSQYEVVPLDHFIRHAEIGTRYYIGGTLGYKC